MNLNVCFSPLFPVFVPSQAVRIYHMKDDSFLSSNQTSNKHISQSANLPCKGQKKGSYFKNSQLLFSLMTK